MYYKTSLVMTLMVIAISCSKSTQDSEQLPPPDPPRDSLGIKEPGYGKSTAGFRGQAWAPPAGISLTTNAHWFEYCSSDTNWVNKKNYVGIPNPMLEYFLVCLEFKNETSQGIPLRFPPFITLQSKHLETQNGVIIAPGFSYLIPAFTVVRIYASAFCLNYNRRAPFDRVDLTNEWTIGPATLPEPLEEIADIIVPKGISYAQILNPDGRTLDTAKAKKLWLIQEAIWEVTDSTGLQPATRQKLMDLHL